MTGPILLRQGTGCPIPGCHGRLRPESNGMGRLIEICDDCVKRTEEHARMGHYFRSLERRIAALEAAVSAPRTVAPSAAPETPARVTSTTAPIPHTGKRGPQPFQANTRTRLVVDVMRDAGRPLMMGEIIAAVHARDPEYSRDHARHIAYYLAQRGVLVSCGRHPSHWGKPKLYTLGPRLQAAELTASDTTSPPAP